MVESKTYNHQNSETLDLVPSKLYLLLDYIVILLGEQNPQSTFPTVLQELSRMMISKEFFVIFKTAAPSGYWAFSKGFTWLKNSMLNFILINLNLTIHVWLVAVVLNNAVLKVNFQQITYLKKISLLFLKTQQNSQKITLSVQKDLSLGKPIGEQ